MLLSPGRMCGDCNNYFGREVEAIALRSYPFSMMRAFGSIPTKKRKWSQVEAVGGWISGSTGGPRLIPRTPRLEERIRSRQNIVLTFPASPSEPLAICRFLIKIGLELATEEGVDVRNSPRFAAALEFARRPQRGTTWWFAVDGTTWEPFLRGQVPDEERYTEVYTTTLEEADDAEMIAVKSYGFFLYAPLVPWLVLPSELTDDSEPAQYYRVMA